MAETLLEIHTGYTHVPVTRQCGVPKFRSDRECRGNGAQPSPLSERTPLVASCLREPS